MHGIQLQGNMIVFCFADLHVNPIEVINTKNKIIGFSTKWIVLSF